MNEMHIKAITSIRVFNHIVCNHPKDICLTLKVNVTVKQMYYGWLYYIKMYAFL